MASQSSQLSLADVFTECHDLLYFNKPAFFVLLEKHIDLDLFIPSDFYHAFNQKFSRHRKYPLYGFISSLILQKILSIPTDSLLIILLHLCKELRVFYGFDKIPDASKFTRFKQDFLPYLEQLFTHLVDYTQPICQAIDPVLASTITFDTTGIEVYVTENNPKTVNALIKRLKSAYKNNPNVDPYKIAYGLMPSTSDASADDSLPMKRIGLCHEQGRSDRIKWGCPKIHKVNGAIVCNCESPCIPTKFGRTTYTYDHQGFRMFPGIQRDSDQWKNLYKILGNIERAINYFKINMCTAGRKTRNVLTTKADTFFAGIASLLTVVLASRIGKPEYIRSLKPLIA